MNAWHASSRAITWALIALFLVPVSAFADPKPKDWNPNIDPANFVSTVDNTYFPLTPGRVMRYEGSVSGNKSGQEVLVVEVRADKKSIMNVMTTVVIETTTIDGQTAEISENWFAQDVDGNVWYFGEATQDLQAGGGTAGSWQAGVAGAQPGIVMPGHPETGTTLFQESAPGVAEDMATIISTTETVTVPYGTFSSVVKTKDWNPLESGRVEHKFYAPGVGLVMEKSGNETLELVSVQ